MDNGTWIALGGLVAVIIVQTVTAAFFFGALSETVKSCKRRIDVLESKPIINHEAKLAAIDVSLQGVKDNMESLENRIGEQFKAMEQTFRNMVQLATSGQRGRRSADG